MHKYGILVSIKKNKVFKSLFNISIGKWFSSHYLKIIKFINDSKDILFIRVCYNSLIQNLAFLYASHIHTKSYSISIIISPTKLNLSDYILNLLVYNQNNLFNIDKSINYLFINKDIKDICLKNRLKQFMNLIYYRKIIIAKKKNRKICIMSYPESVKAIVLLKNNISNINIVRRELLGFGLNCRQKLKYNI